MIFLDVDCCEIKREESSEREHARLQSDTHACNPTTSKFTRANSRLYSFPDTEIVSMVWKWDLVSGCRGGLGSGLGGIHRLPHLDF